MRPSTARRGLPPEASTHGTLLQMDEYVRQQARDRHGLVLAQALGAHPARAAERAGLVRLRVNAYVAGTQPRDIATLLEAVRFTAGPRRWAVLGAGALWLYGLEDRPDQLSLGIQQGHKLTLLDPRVRVRRVADRLLVGTRTRRGWPVVAPEVAAIGVAGSRSVVDTRTLVEDLVRARHTTLARLRARCYRGVKGSARMRKTCDELAGGSLDADVRRLRTALELRGVTGLEVEVRFEASDGGVAYGDLFHVASRTLIEVDGFLSHGRRDQFRADRRRDRWVRREHGAHTLRVDVLEIREDLDRLVDELLWFLLPPVTARLATA